MDACISVPPGAYLRLRDAKPVIYTPIRSLKSRFKYLAPLTYLRELISDGGAIATNCVPRLPVHTRQCTWPPTRPDDVPLAARRSA